MMVSWYSFSKITIQLDVQCQSHPIMSWAHPDWLSCRLFHEAGYNAATAIYILRGFDTNVAPKSVIITPLCWLRCSAHIMSPHRYYSSSYILHSMFLLFFSAESQQISFMRKFDGDCVRDWVLPPGPAPAAEGWLTSSALSWSKMQLADRSALLCSALSVCPLCLLISARLLFCRITSHAFCDSPETAWGIGTEAPSCGGGWLSCRLSNMDRQRICVFVTSCCERAY